MDTAGRSTCRPLRLWSPRQPGNLRKRKIRGFASHRYRWFALMEGDPATTRCNGSPEGGLPRINTVTVASSLAGMHQRCQARRLFGAQRRCGGVVPEAAWTGRDGTRSCLHDAYTYLKPISTK